MNQDNQQSQPIGIESDINSDVSSPELLKQINTQAGIHMLHDLLKSGVIKTNPDPVEDKVAIHLSSHDALKKDKPALKDLANDEIHKHLSRFAEKLGATPVPMDDKGKEKLRLAVRKLVTKLPGMQRVGMGSIDNVAGELLQAFVKGDPDLSKVIEHEVNYNKKKKHLNNKVDGIFEGNYPSEDSHDPKDLEKIHDYLKDGEMTSAMSETQGFAGGGEVHKPVTDGIGEDQNMMIGAGKTRINAYLNSLRPQDNPKLPYDTGHTTKESKKKYENALKIAANPLSMLDHIPKGTVSPTNLKHFASLHPELHNMVSKKITEKITKQQAEGKKPPYKIRQGLAMMLGTPLESTMTPMSIQAAQSVFAPKQPQQPAAGAPKMAKGTAKLGSKSNSLYNTADQDAEVDRSTRK